MTVHILAPNTLYSYYIRIFQAFWFNAFSEKHLNAMSKNINKYIFNPPDNYNLTKEIKYSSTCKLSVFVSRCQCMNSIYYIKHVCSYKIVNSTVFFLPETSSHILNLNCKQWLKRIMFHNPEVLSIHLKLLSLWKFTGLSGSACLITGSHIITVEFGGIFTIIQLLLFLKSIWWFGYPRSTIFTEPNVR